MLSFHNDQNIKDQLIKNLESHAMLDHFTQGQYWEDGKGCAVGCSIVDFGGKTDDHSEYERLFGIPRAIARLEDGIFEGLSVEDSKWWPLAFSSAVQVGKDLSLVIPKFIVWLLDDVKKYASNKDVIEDVITLYIRKINGDVISRSDWKSAADADAAYAAAYADAAYAAAYADAAVYADAAYAAAAYDAADAAYAAAAAYAAKRSKRKAQALKLIEILKSVE